MGNPTKVPARERLDRDELASLQNTGTLIIDDRRRRPLYFDGRFLAARDLTREQGYFLTRQASLGRTMGSGIVHGLLVERGDTATTVNIDAGHGVTPSGEIVSLSTPLSVSLADIAEAERLDAAFGIRRIPRQPSRNRSGLFIIALRPVEFTANPIASYPTSITDRRDINDGDIIEGTVATLIPYPDEGARNELDMRRARVSREIFVEGATKGVPAGVLPLAMIALDRGLLQWVDPYMVRREIGSEQRNILGLGLSHPALREAHLLQYDQHLQEILKGRDTTGRGRRFGASEHFHAVPPAGRMPAAGIDPEEFTHIYFPQEVRVELSIIPDDEVPALLDESLLLPPIDLTLSNEELEATSVLVCIPVPRQQMRTLSAKLGTLTRQVKPATPGLVAKRTPLEKLRGLILPRVAIPRVSAETLVDAAWRQVLASSDLLWYVRRRNLQVNVEVVGKSLLVGSDELSAEKELAVRLRNTGLTNRFTNLKRRASALADAEMVSMLASPKFLKSKTLMQGAIRELEIEGKLEKIPALKVTERFADPKLGEGLTRLEAVKPDLLTRDKVLAILTRSAAIPELDRLARKVKDAELETLARDLENLAKENKPEKIATFVKEKLKAVEQ